MRRIFVVSGGAVDVADDFIGKDDLWLWANS